VGNNGARRLKIEQLEISIHETNEALGEAAAEDAASTIKAAIAARGRSNIVLATGNSQVTFLAALRMRPDIDWAKVVIFHLDEYVGIDPSHPASFPWRCRDGLREELSTHTIHGRTGLIKLTADALGP